MTAQSPNDEKLSADTARRVLERASELDAAQSAGMSIAQLRAAAREAGIPATAFELALSEVRFSEQPALAENTWLTRRRILFWAGAVPGLIIGGVTVIAILSRLFANL